MENGEIPCQEVGFCGRIKKSTHGRKSHEMPFL